MCNNFVHSTVKDLITSEQVLCHYNPELPVKLACDASPYGLGAVLSHIMPDDSERPIAFASRSLTKAEKAYSQIDKEALGLYWGIKKFHTYLHGRRFTLMTDHKPLVSILHPQKSIPAMTAARLQRYALFLAGHTYDIEYRSTHNHCNADGLSRLPLSSSATENYIDEASVFYTSQLEKLPVSSVQVRRETQRDPILSEVLDCVFRGTSKLPKDDVFKPYRNRETELTCHQNCVMWGNRVVVPETLRTTVLEELHDGHLGIIRMKNLARSYVWWPNIDSNIEQMCKSCVGCQTTSNMPKAAPVHPWDWPTTPWDRLHVDFAGPFMDSMFLIVVDSHSKWPEVYPMKSTTTSLTIEKLRILFSQYGIPRQLVSDNGPQFTSKEFEMFMKQNGIRHITSAPYHPRTNGLAERFVQTFKMSMKHAKGDNRNRSLQEQLSVFLLKYRTKPHALTNETPSKLLYGRNLRTRLDLVKPDLTGKVLESQNRMKLSKHCSATVREFTPGQRVMVREYRCSDKKWIPAQIQDQTGPLSYTVDPGHGILWRRHTDQLRPTAVDPTTTVSPETLQLPEPAIPAISIPSTIADRETMLSRQVTSSTRPKGTPATKSPSVPDVASSRRYPRRENIHPPIKLDL
ncbi:uncharacterized protein K02A2.6-like [Pecten maximus]|uniref:uncharacterized protein K02A2.6-like n=1 Tax=Pecten maximus TaxID=6579 RepID=UPI001458FD59|nr:uncharacterized protein K02A2.6-like [Pecten maximus]